MRNGGKASPPKSKNHNIKNNGSNSNKNHANKSKQEELRSVVKQINPGSNVTEEVVIGNVGGSLESIFNPFLPTVPTFAVRETDVSRHNGGTSGAPLKPLRVDSALKALSTLRGLRGAPEVPPLCRETSVSRTANVGT